MKTIGVTGKIGSGKSLVCRIISTLGFPVYDCDRRAKLLLQNSTRLIAETEKIVGKKITVDGVLNKSLLASCIFNNRTLLQKVNELIHKEVRSDIANTIDKLRNYTPFFFIESAILQSSGIENIVDETWWIEAPNDIRRDRVMRFRNVDADDFEKRDLNQCNDNMCSHHRIIINDGATPLLPQIETLLER